MEKIIEINNVKKSFNNIKVLDGVTLSISKGEIYGLLGLNGSGKTTLMKIILGLIKKDFGEIKVKGSIMHDLETPKKVGAVIEYPAFYEYLDAKRNLFIFSELYDVPKTRVSDVLKLVGLDVNDKKKVKNYSMGMKQRLSIARAFLNDPDIIILDEPTNGLDPVGVVEIENLILKLAKKENKTFIITSHILSQIEKMCNRVAIISNGKIVTEGNVKTLLSSDKEQYMLEFDEYIDVHRVSKILNDLATIKSADNNKIVIEIQKSDIGNISSVFVENHMHIKDIQKITHDLEDNFIRSELHKTNKVFMYMITLSAFLSVAVLNLIYIYDNSYKTIKNTILIDYIEVNNVLSGETALIMPILCIVVCAFIWTIDFESGCIKYIFSQISRKNWMITKIVTSVITIFFLYFILGVGLTSIAYLLGNKEIITVSYLKQFILLLVASIPLIIWELFTAIVSVTYQEFGKTVGIVLVLFLLFYILDNYFPNMRGIFPTSALIYIWGYSNINLLIKNILGVIIYSVILVFALRYVVKNKEV